MIRIATLKQFTSGAKIAQSDAFYCPRIYTTTIRFFVIGQISPERLSKGEEMRYRIDLNRDDVLYLEIEYDDKHTGGYYLYHITKTNAFDNWFETLEQAFRQAELDYGVSKHMWKLID